MPGEHTLPLSGSPWVNPQTLGLNTGSSIPLPSFNAKKKTGLCACLPPWGHRRHGDTTPWELVLAPTQMEEHNGHLQPSAVLQLVGRSRRCCGPVLWSSFQRPLQRARGLVQLDRDFYSQKPYQHYTCVIWPLQCQQKENVAFSSACFLHHFLPGSFLCYFILFPHCGYLNNF